MKKISKILVVFIMYMVLMSKNVQADVITPGQAIRRQLKNTGTYDIVVTIFAAVIIAITAVVVMKLINNSKKK